MEIKETDPEKNRQPAGKPDEILLSHSPPCLLKNQSCNKIMEASPTDLIHELQGPLREHRFV